MAGTFSEADYCPTWGEGYTNRVCTSTASIAASTNINWLREVFGPSSRCLDTTFHGNVDGSVTPDFVIDQPGCYDILCHSTNASYEVRVQSSGSVVDKNNWDTVLGTCPQAGQMLTKSGYGGS